LKPRVPKLALFGDAGIKRIFASDGNPAPVSMSFNVELGGTGVSYALANVKLSAHQRKKRNSCIFSLANFFPPATSYFQGIKSN
jgi:hypothetical protein